MSLSPCKGRVKVSLTYLGDFGARVKGPTERPYKWTGECSCGWNVLSWSWSRPWDCDTSGDPVQWVKDNGYPDGGALIYSLEHLGL